MGRSAIYSLLLLFGGTFAVQYNDLMVENGLNDASSQKLDNTKLRQKTTSLKTMLKTPLLLDNIPSQTTNVTEIMRDNEVLRNDSTKDVNWTKTSKHRRLSASEIRRKMRMFWATVIMIIVLWVFILIGLGVIVYIRVVYMHHTITQIFCPED